MKRNIDEKMAKIVNSDKSFFDTPKVEHIRKSINVKKLINLCMIAFVFLTIASYVFHLFGIKYFLLTYSKTFPFILDEFIRACMFMINMFFVFSISLKIYDKRIFRILIWYIPILIISSMLFPNSLIFTALIPLLYCIVCGVLYKNSIKERFFIIIRYVLFSIVIILYQAVAIKIKLNLFGAADFGKSAGLINSLLCNIDLFIVMILIYVKEGEKNGHKLVVHSDNVGDVEQSHEDVEAVNKYNGFNKWQKAKIMTVVMVIQLLQFVAVFGLCAIGNVWYELCVILPMFWLSRRHLKPSWHSNNIYICTIISVLSFYIASKFTIPIKYSLFSPVVIGLLLAYTFYWLKNHNINKPFLCKSATEAEMRKRCLALGIRGDKAELAVKAFILKTPRKELLIDEYDTIGNVNSRISKLKKKLEALS